MDSVLCVKPPPKNHCMNTIPDMLLVFPFIINKRVILPFGFFIIFYFYIYLGRLTTELTSQSLSLQGVVGEAECGKDDWLAGSLWELDPDAWLNTRPSCTVTVELQ